ncbi:hypothetical protein JOD97_000839 [Duganella sp. 1411]|uniref:DUF6708 domain-containing protein n=1 Tax=Duganella sp. 1411 TaxID=2806572 RepID=UPI001AE28771|nr:DUF6708 domain-containing protein [Duganella sp. 1411]MBP1202825.1 hypothetical protein [Duganella sp. 1411]
MHKEKLEEKSSNNISGAIKKFDKHKSAASTALTFWLIKKTYSDAIEYTGIARGTRGLIIFAGLIASSLGFWFGWRLILDSLRWGIDGFVGWFSILCAIGSLIFGFYIAIKSVRLEFFRPEDEPTIFDRKNRKVYRIYRETYSGWRGLLRPWPVKTATYEWDLVDAEHHAQLNSNTATVSRIHSLVFLVRKNSADPSIVDTFQIGNSMQMSEVTVPAVWEHIRRFMEENGPHLLPGEVLFSFEKPKNWWESVLSAGPYGGNFKNIWQHHRFFAVASLIFFPIIFPFIILVGSFAWLSFETSTRIGWAPEVLQAVGDPIS